MNQHSCSYCDGTGYIEAKGQDSATAFAGALQSYLEAEAAPTTVEMTIIADAAPAAPPETRSRISPLAERTGR